MTIRADYQHPVDCACGRSATQVEIEVHTEHGIRRPTYHVHAECLTDPAHAERLKEVAEFFEAMDKLAYDANQDLPELEKGFLRDIDLGYIQPSACESFEKASPLITIGGFGQQSELVLEPIVVKSTTAAELQTLAIEAANKGIEALETKFKRGQF